jgi:hypothetical protein
MKALSSSCEYGERFYDGKSEFEEDPFELTITVPHCTNHFGNIADSSVSTVLNFTGTVRKIC